MKKILVALCCVGLLVIAGCGGDSDDPVGFSKNYIEKKLGGNNCDLSKLKYKVVDESDENAVIKISGTIEYLEELALEKKDDKWVVSAKAPKHVPAKKEAQPKKEADHGKKAAPAKKEEAAKH